MTKSQRKINVEKQWLFFYLIYQIRGNVSELSDQKLYGSLSSTWFHHILPKSKYPELRYCVDNIIVLTADEHNAVENGTIYEEVEKRKIDIQNRYDELVEETEHYVENYLNPMYEHAVKNTVFFKQNQH
jgi:hypothetical protein